MTRRVYLNEIEGGNAGGRPPVKWRDRVQEYIRERGKRSLTIKAQGCFAVPVLPRGHIQAQSYLIPTLHNFTAS